jgi:hypothetical protein
MVAAMDSPTIRGLRIEWLALGTARASHLAYCRLGACEPVVAALGAEDLAELVAALSPSSLRLTRTDAPGVIAAMQRSAQIDPLIPQAVVQARVLTALTNRACPVERTRTKIFSGRGIRDASGQRPWLTWAVTARGSVYGTAGHQPLACSVGKCDVEPDPRRSRDLRTLLM